MRPVRNFSNDPRSVRAATAATGADLRADFSRMTTEFNDTPIVDALDGPPGLGITSYARRIRKTSGTSSGRGFSLASGNLSDATLALDAGAPCTPGETLSFLGTVRVSSMPVAWRFFIRFALAGSTAWQAANTTSAQVAVNPGEWTQLAGQFLVPAGVDRFTAIAGMSVVTQPAGEALDFTAFMVARGRYSGPYLDGYSPMAKWDGAPDASTSIGYPPLAAA